VVAFSLFTDYFLSGMVMPLMPHSPAKIVEGQLGLLYSGYAISVPGRNAAVRLSG